MLKRLLSSILVVVMILSMATAALAVTPDEWRESMTEMEMPEDCADNLSEETSARQIATTTSVSGNHLEILSTDDVEGDKVEGTVYSIKKAKNGDVIGTYTSDAVGSVSVDLEPGQYMIVPVYAPEGYMTAGETYEVEVEELAFPIQAIRFSDVPLDYWAFDEINEIVGDNVMKGTTETTFSPEDSISVIQFVVIFTRIFYADEVAGSEAVGTWYAANLDVANQAHLLDNVNLDNLNAPISYEQMIQIISTYTDSIADYTSESIPEDFVERFNEVFYLEFEQDTEYFSAENGVNRAEFAVLYSNAKKVLTNVTYKDYIEGTASAEETVAGAVYEFYTEGGMDESDYRGTFTTDESGSFSVDNLTPGYYLIREISVPEGYSLTGKTEKIYVSGDSVSLIATRDTDSETGDVIVALGEAAEYTVTEVATPNHYTVDPGAVEKIEGATEEQNKTSGIDKEITAEKVVEVVLY